MARTYKAFQSAAYASSQAARPSFASKTGGVPFNPDIRNPVTLGWGVVTVGLLGYVWAKSRAAMSEPMPPRVDPRVFMTVPAGMGAGAAGQQDYGGKIM